MEEDIISKPTPPSVLKSPPRPPYIAIKIIPTGFFVLLIISP
ncbi:hypothetical protein JCM19237_6363 [Photobacterium aphoticum]|uniref:Uncharacterized protein n=1 Tax=Photobacterium aphoticum TaxID=754436 RepID=A0A090QNT7_9GAMM|nr:hypothetical protein JCM19237_6363 [Photobacterium aphoticum]